MNNHKFYGGVADGKTIACHNNQYIRLPNNHGTNECDEYSKVVYIDEVGDEQVAYVESNIVSRAIATGQCTSGTEILKHIRGQSK